jgi:hypothetical protein
MYAMSINYANEHIESLIADADKSRMIAKLSRPSLRQRLVSLASNVRSAFSDPAAAPGSVVPAVH